MYEALISYRSLEELNHQLRDRQKEVEIIQKEYEDTVQYEDHLYQDLTRGGGGGLVRKLGGQVCGMLCIGVLYMRP